MKFRGAAALLGLLLAVLSGSLNAASVNFGVQYRSGNAPPSGAVLWSTLGVVADGVTDNTAALNALDVSNPIVGDCPAGSTINFAGQWLWKSNFSLYMKAGCVVVTTFAPPTDLGFASITQASMGTALTNVYVDGLYLKRLEPVSQTGNLHRSYLLNINHFTMTRFTVDVYHQAFYVQGSDQEFAYGFLTNSCKVPGCDGLRHIGNVPKVATSPGRPANVWVHDNVFVAGDAPLQSCQPQLTRSGSTANVSSDDQLWDNNYGASSASSVILIGEQNLDAASSHVSCTNITFNRTTGSGSSFSILVAASFAPMVVQNVTITNATLAISQGGSLTPHVQLTNILGGTLDHVTLDHLVLQNVAGRDAVINGGTNTTISNSVFPSPTYLGQPSVTLEHDTGTTITGSSIGANLGAAVVLGMTGAVSTNPTISNNTITGITTNQSGVLLGQTSGASVTGNTISRKPGSNGTRGVTLTTASGSNPGTTNSTVTGNDLTGVTGNPNVICAASGQGNVVSGNTGAVPSSCP